jgi:hypothetical protein
MHWWKPPLDFIKVNTEKSYVYGQAAYGDIIRNHNVNFLKGFMCKFGLGNALFSELKGIFFVFKIIIKMQFIYVILEIDFIPVIYFHFHFQRLLQEVIHLINLLGSTIHINHIHRETNTWIDILSLEVINQFFLSLF